MKANLGTIDRVLRVLVAIVLGVLYVTGVVSGTLGIVLSVVAVVLLATSVFGFCPLYVALKLSTKKAQ
jgi:hypothetical protein